MYDTKCEYYSEILSNDGPGPYTIRTCELGKFDIGDCDCCKHSSIQRPHTNESDMRKYLESIGF